MEATRPHTLTPSAFLTPPSLPPPTVRMRSPSKSPTRVRFTDDLLSDLSPATTLEAFTSQSGKLRASIEAATETERAFGIRAALASKKIEEWLQELLAWQWPSAGDRNGFESDVSAKQAGTRHGDQEADDERQGEAYIGCLTAVDVQNHGTRLDEIQEDMNDLGMEDIKRQVLDSHCGSRSRPSTPTSPMVTTNHTPYARMEDFTAVVTVTVLRMLPALSRLLKLMDVWNARLSILERIPTMLARMDNAEVALKQAWAVIDSVHLGTASAAPTKPLDREIFTVMRDILQARVTILGQELDHMLDSLEGRSDTLPDVWLDRMERIEKEYGSWSVAAEGTILRTEQAARQIEARPVLANDGQHIQDIHQSDHSPRGENPATEDLLCEQLPQDELANPDVAGDTKAEEQELPGTPENHVERPGQNESPDHLIGDSVGSPYSKPINASESESHKEQDGNENMGTPPDDQSFVSSSSRANEIAESDVTAGQTLSDAGTIYDPKSGAAAETLNDTGSTSLSDDTAQSAANVAKKQSEDDISQSQVRQAKQLQQMPSQIDTDCQNLHENRVDDHCPRRDTPYELQQPGSAETSPEFEHSNSSPRSTIDMHTHDGAFESKPDSKRSSISMVKLDPGDSNHDLAAATNLVVPMFPSLNGHRPYITSTYAHGLVDSDYDNEPTMHDENESVFSDLSPPSSPRKALFRHQRSVSSALSDTSDPHSEAPVLHNVAISSQPTGSSEESNSEAHLQRQIHSILSSLPSDIRLADSTTAKSPASTLNTRNIRRSTPSLALGSRATTPATFLTLVPAGSTASNPNRSRATAATPDIKLYHLTRSTGEKPIKLFVRLVGEHGERVMVRVGGGWADLGEYLKEYVLHHGRQRGVEASRVEIQDLGSRQSNGPGMTLSRGGSPACTERPMTSLAIRKHRVSIGTTDRSKSHLHTPSSRRVVSSIEPRSADPLRHGPPHEGSAQRTTRLSWGDGDSGATQNLGLAGPLSKGKELPAWKRDWVESMTERVRLASAERDLEDETSSSAATSSKDGSMRGARGNLDLPKRANLSAPKGPPYINNDKSPALLRNGNSTNLGKGGK